MGVEGASDGRRQRRDVRVHLLGAFGVQIGGRRPHLPLLAQRLAALLAISLDVSRSRAAGTLWPDIDDIRAQANLRTALWRLRATSGRLVDVDGSALRLHDEVAVDLRRGEEVAHRILDDSLAPEEGFLASELLAADLLPDWGDDWLVFERERYLELRVHALERLCERLAADGQHAEAVECGLLAVQAEPLRESAHRALIRAHIAEGNPARAVQQLHALEDRLREELQVEPSLPTLELAAELMDAGHPVARPPASHL